MCDYDGPSTKCPFGLCRTAFDPCYDVRTRCNDHLTKLGYKLKKVLNSDKSLSWASIFCGASGKIVIVPGHTSQHFAKIVLTVSNGKCNHRAFHKGYNLCVTVCALGVSGKVGFSTKRNSDAGVVQVVKALLAKPEVIYNGSLVNGVWQLM